MEKHSNHSQISVQVPTSSSLEEFFAEQEIVLRSEIAYLKQSGGKRAKLFEGKLVEEKNGSYIYSFESDSELNFPDNTKISLYSSFSQDTIQARVVNCEDFTVIVASSRYLGNNIPNIEFSAEPWRLLESLVDRLQRLRDNALPSSIVKSLVCDGRKMIQSGKEIKKGQDTACQMSISQRITFIWGPPGTGKTETLAKIALLHLRQGSRVLMLSYSNVSVDGAIWRVFNKDVEKKPGKLVRYGYPRDKDLLQHEYLTSYNLVLKNHPELLEERTCLIEERKHLSKTSSRYVETGIRLTQIKEKLVAEEKRVVSDASFVATTVSKAIVDSVLYKDTYDTVIFDEASMAYIPQIVFSAGLAQKHFICMGDFAQLPPIVQSNGFNSLNADIFNFCGIVNAVDEGVGHKWLCMLDTQYRMHPEIAAFSSRTMYRGLLKSGKNMESQRKQIVGDNPFPGDALRLVDLGGMYSVCSKTADKSHINVLSAFVSLGLAVNAAKNYEVGIITPYNAQSRLLHAMSRDVTERDSQLHSITCATVHQFQGSEKDVIIYDAVDCYLMRKPGTLLASTVNDYANRLYNVAVTRAKGKMISVVNVDYMKAKNFSKSLIFREMMDSLEAENKSTRKSDVASSIASPILESFTTQAGGEEFLRDLERAKSGINIDIPKGTSSSPRWLQKLSETLQNVKKRGVKVFIRTDNKVAIPKEIKPLVIENKFITNPIALIDRSIVWYGMPSSDASFISGGQTIPTLFKPILRFKGKHFARSLYGFLEMSRTVDTSDEQIEIGENSAYSTFASYVAGEIKCSSCGAKMILRKGKKFFLGCSAYPKCENTRQIDPDTVENYFYFNNLEGKRCPQDNTSLEAKDGKYGVYARCCNETDRHTFRLDEI